MNIFDRFAIDIAETLCGEIEDNEGNEERMAFIVSIMAAGLGHAIAMAAGGDGEKVDTMMTMAEAAAHEAAVQNSAHAANNRGRA